MIPDKHETDEILFALLAKDSERAFGTLYKRYWDKLIEVAFYKLQSQSDAEEVVQQVFLEIWNNRAHKVLRYTFRTYISAALKYKIFGRLTERKRSAHVQIDSDASDNHIHFIDDSTRQLLDFNEMRDQLEIAVSQLPEKCELVFRLSREDGLSTKEIASQLNISVKTVEAHISKALKAIKSTLHDIWMFDILLISLFCYFF